jgi:hypothetical protein
VANGKGGNTVTQRPVLIFCAVFLSLAGRAMPADKAPKTVSLDLESFLTERDPWHLSPTEFRERSQSKFRQGLCKTELMYANRGDNAFTFLGSPIEECVVRLDAATLKNLYILLRYTRHASDADKIKTAHSTAAAALSRLCHGPGHAQEFSWSKGEKIAIRQWKTSAARVRLYASDGVPFGYVSVLVERADLPEREMLDRLRATVKHLPRKIVDGSSVCLAVPMRHQLRGIGACWSATLGRQFAYLGSEIEPQMAAQMTVPHEESQLRAWESKLGVVVKSFHFFETHDAGRNAVNLLMKYNQLAAHRGDPPIKYTETAKTITFVDGFQHMDARVLKNIPPGKHDHEKYAEFRKMVTTFIDRSVPLSWTVTRWSSKDGKGGGRHRRMIVGYDADRDLIYYSDPWGFDSDRHSMPMRAAFAMTLWTQAIYPHSIAHGELAVSSHKARKAP